MPNPASGVFKQLAYKSESTFGTVPSASGAQSLRRVQSTLDLSKDTYQSNEIRADQQVADMRHGVRRVTGQITGELSPATYKDFFAQILRRDFTALSAISGVSVTIAGTGPYTVTRASGSFLTDGLKAGDVIRITAGSVNAANLNKNLLITGLTATVLTVIVLNGSSLIAEGPIASCTVTLAGKKTFVPASAQTDRSFSIEHWFSDLGKSEVFSGCKASKIAIQMPPTGMVTVAVDITGQNVTTATSQYFTSPTGASTSGCLASVNGVLRVGGTAVATLTGLSLDVNSNFTGDPVVGANTVPFLYPGRILVSGQATAYFDSTTLRDAFLDETELDLLAVFTASSDKDAKFVSFVLPRIKLGGASKNDGEGGIIQTLPFTALLNTAGGTALVSEYTTISIQDSDA